MTVLFICSGLFLFLCGCCCAFGIMHYARKNDMIAVETVDEESNQIDLSVTPANDRRKTGKGKDGDEVDFYGHGAFDRAEGSNANLKYPESKIGKKNKIKDAFK